MSDEMLHLLAQELGSIVEWEEQCPGVYYLATEPKDEESRFATELYLVFDDAPVTQEVRAMGERLDSVPAWAYPADTYESPKWAVLYEAQKYLTVHGLPLPEGESLRDTALYGREVCPDYFGPYPAPAQTPWGYTLRYRALDAGIYWIETDQCTDVLAVCGPVWEADLTEGLQELAGKMDYEEGMGYRYFNRELSCVAVFELMQLREKWTEEGLIRKAELMNAIWEYQPGYAMGYNAEEQAGRHDMLGMLLYELGITDRKLERSVERMIAITPEVGTDFIGFWK